MFIDLNVPIPFVPGPVATQSKKGKEKAKHQQQQQAPSVVFTPAQLTAIESRIDMLIHLGYTVIGLNQTAHKKVDPKTHVNVLDPLLTQLRKRTGVVFVKRLTIILDEESEKGFGLTTSNASLFTPYDLIALMPTTAPTFSLACLTHTAPSPLTAHIVSLPLTLPRLPFNLKHTLIRTALKNGAVFEVNYAGALGAEGSEALGGGEGGTSGKRNWWAGAREVVRVTKGRGILVSGGGVNEADLRAPRDVANLMTILGLPQDVAHDAATKTAQSLILRAQTRKTYRAVLSEPKIVIPEGWAQSQETSRPTAEPAASATENPPAVANQPPPSPLPPSKTNGTSLKRPLEEGDGEGANVTNSKGTSMSSGAPEGSSRKKKRKNKSGDRTTVAG